MIYPFKTVCYLIGCVSVREVMQVVVVFPILTSR